MIIDLTYPLHNGMFKYPSDPEAEIGQKKAEIVRTTQEIWDESTKIGFCEVEKYGSGYNEIKMRNHHGTHIDAPAHKIPEGRTINSYPIDKFVNSCALLQLNYGSGILGRQDRKIRPEDLGPEFLLNQIALENPRALIIYTGFCDEMQEREGKFSADNIQQKQEFEKTFPYLTTEATRYLIDKFPNLQVIGLDSFSVDKKGSNSEVHRDLLSKDILVLENLVNLRILSNELLDRKAKDPYRGRKFRLYSVPINILGGDAAQARAYAEI